MKFFIIISTLIINSVFGQIVIEQIISNDESIGFYFDHSYAQKIIPNYDYNGDGSNEIIITSGGSAQMSHIFDLKNSEIIESYQSIENGKILIKDSTCPALHAQLQATEKSVPFMPLRGVIGSDIQKHRKDWHVIANPMKSSGVKDEPVLLLPAIQLDVLVFHAACSDRNGNIQIGRRRELATLAHASKKVFVTVEKVLDIDFFEDELSAATCLPALYVDGISIVKNGAWPCALPGVYGSDNEEIKKYSLAAKTKEGFREYMKHCLKN